MNVYPLEQLQSWIDESRHIVFFGGAGVSTESQIPDFRSVDGLYHQSYQYPPETILSHSFFEKKPEEFFRFYREKMLFPNARPNTAHCKLAELERAGKLDAVVTQNIDGLHQAAGSQRVFELHGSVHRNYCVACHRFYALDYLLHGEGIPTCPVCGGVVKPDVVLYEEALDEKTVYGAVQAIRGADLLIIGGTSLAVYPAAGLIHDYRGSRLVLVNQSPTPYDREADLVIAAPIGALFSQIRVHGSERA